VYTALVTTQMPGRATLDSWHSEYQADENYRADALVLAHFNGKAAAIFLEVDLGTERPALVARKVEALAGYRAQGSHRESTWWQSGMSVALLVAASSARAEQLRPIVAASSDRLGLVAGVSELGELRKQPWPYLEGLARQTADRTMPQVPPPGGSQTAPRRGTSRYTPAWRRGTPEESHGPRGAGLPTGGA